MRLEEIGRHRIEVRAGDAVPGQQPVHRQPHAAPAAGQRLTTHAGRLTGVATHMTNEMERAFYASDPAWDGRFVAAVRTTGIFCRPSCRVRKPLPRNVEYLADASVARAAGYRPACAASPRSSTPVTPARRRDADRADDDRRHRSRSRAVRLQRAADDAVPAGLRPPADRPDELRRRAAARPRRGPAAGVLRRHTRRVRPADRHARERLPAAGLGRAAPDPVRRDDQLPRARRARRRRRARTGPSAGQTARTGWRSSCPATA